MRLIKTADCETGLILAKTVYDEKNRILLNNGAVLTENIISRLKAKSISHIYIESRITKGIKVQDDIPVPLRIETGQQMSKVFKAITGEEHSKVQDVSNGKALREFKIVYDRLLNEIKYSPKLINLLSHMQIGNNRVLEHSLNVSMYAITIGRHLAVSDKDMYVLGLGGMFHDIGKSKLSAKLLNKKQFTKEEEAEYQKHTTLGFEILRRNRDLHLVISHCAYQHHEHMDGTGYPRGLKGKDIHPFAKIISVANLFDNLTRPKAGVKPLLPHEAMEVILGYGYTRFDPKIIEAFRKSVAIYPIGVTVTLNTGEKGVVVDYNPHSPQRPKIRLFTDREGNRLDDFNDMDLMVALDKMIVECDAILDEGK